MTTEETRTYYLTKYVLSKKGIIQEVSGKPCRTDSLYVAIDGQYGLFLLGRDVFEAWPEALANAESRRTSKIASLKRQIAKLEKMTFEVKP